MGFTELVNTTLFNSILVPTKFGSSGNDVPEMGLGGLLQKTNSKIKEYGSGSLNCKCVAKIKIGEKETQLKSCTIVNAFKMSRDVTKRECGDYTANFPGPVKYDPVALTFYYSGDTYILDWLKAGIDDGGSYPVNLVFEFEVGSNKTVITLLDAYLSKWELLSEAGLTPKVIGLKYSSSGNGLDKAAEKESTLMEKLTFNYSGIQISLGT